MEIVRKKFKVGRVRSGAMEHGKHCAVKGWRCITVCQAYVPSTNTRRLLQNGT